MKKPVFFEPDSDTRKRMPVATGVMAYFPLALLIVSMVSRAGAEKHCGGRLGWAKHLSTDEPDAEVRHMLDFYLGLCEPIVPELGRLGPLATKAWRALAHLEREAEAEIVAYRATEALRRGGFSGA